MTYAVIYWTMKTMTLRRRLMNTFRQSLEELSQAPLPLEGYEDVLPGVPSFLTRKDTAFVLHVSPQTVDRMIEKGDLIINHEDDILKADLVTYILNHTLADQPVLEEK
jgi:hypothetical protein